MERGVGRLLRQWHAGRHPSADTDDGDAAAGQRLRARLTAGQGGLDAGDPVLDTGTFTSRAIDGGAPTAWGAITWTADLPAGTSVAVSARTGNTATPDGTWTAFTAIGSSGASLNQTGRYVQYRLQLTTSNTGQTPLVRDVTVNGANQ